MSNDSDQDTPKDIEKELSDLEKAFPSHGFKKNWSKYDKIVDAMPFEDELEAIDWKKRLRDDKKLRYAMELVAGAFDDSFREELYPVFAEVQERLGIINDHATAAVMFTQWSEDSGDQSLVKLAEQETEHFESAAQEFRQWWTPARAQELRNCFEELLARESAA